MRARTFAGAMDDAADVVQRLRQAEASRDFRVLGPAPAPLGKLRGEYRAQLLIKGTNRKRMREALHGRARGAAGARSGARSWTSIRSQCSEIAGL